MGKADNDVSANSSDVRSNHGSIAGEGRGRPIRRGKSINSGTEAENMKGELKVQGGPVR